MAPLLRNGVHEERTGGQRRRHRERYAAADVVKPTYSHFCRQYAAKRSFR